MILKKEELEALDRVIAQQGLISRSVKHETQAGVDYKLLKQLRNRLENTEDHSEDKLDMIGKKKEEVV